METYQTRNLNISIYPNRHLMARQKGISGLVYIIALVVLAGIITFVIALLHQVGYKDCGYDRECFIKAANKCQEATLRQNNAGIIRFDTANCALKKTIETFAPDEVNSVKLLFQGKTMSCKYDKGTFDEELLDGIAGGLGLCTGELSDAVYALRLAQVS